MNSVAEQTGGKAFYNTNDLNKAIRDSMEDGSTYYTLGYYPENKELGRPLPQDLGQGQSSGS